MERGDGFWTSGNKGWKTRREQQDAYRRALDDQIQERKQMDHTRSLKFRTPESPKIQDPVQHLMPWLNSESSQPPVSSPYPSPGQPQVMQYSTPTPVYGSPPPHQPTTNYYYVANPIPHQPIAQQLPPAGVQSHPAEMNPVPTNREQQGPFAYYGPSPIPPPPAFVSAATSSYPGYVYGAPVMPPQPSVVPGYNHPTVQVHQQGVPPCPIVSPPYHTSMDSMEKPRSNSVTMSTDSRKEIRENNEKDSKRNALKIHVSQTSAELPNGQPKDEYRMDLAKQVEEKRRKDEERLKREQEEEDRLQRKIKDDQERAKREHEEDLRRAKEREEEEKRKASEKVRNFEQVKKKLDDEKAEIEKQQRQKLLEERHQQLKNAANNSRAALSTSPSRYYHRDDETSKSWPWESTPVKAVNTTTQIEEGSGDAKTNNQHRHHGGNIMSGQSNSTSIKSSARKLEDYEETQPTSSVSSSRTYSLSEACQEDEHEQSYMSRVPSGASKSAEDFGGASNEMMMCPRCSRSFSSNDIQYPKSAGERLKVLNFLNNIQKRLKEDHDKMIKSGYEWKR